MVGVIVIGALVILLLLRLVLNGGKPIGTFESKTRPGGPGKYRVDGVDKKTQAEKTIYVEASSEVVARVKAEIQGLVVTSCVKI